MGIVVLKGGLGNQLFQIANSMKFENEPILLDWCVARPVLELNGKVSVAEYELPSNFHYQKSRRTIDRILKPTYLARQEVNRLFSDDISSIDMNYISRIKLFTYFKKARLIFPWVKKNEMISNIQIGYFQEIPDLSENQLTKLRRIKLSRYSNIVSELCSFAKEQKPVIVHMRIGDYEGNEDLGVLPMDYYEQALNHLSEHVPNFEKTPIWLFSDSPEKAIDKFPSKYMHQMILIRKGDMTSAETLEVMRLGKNFVISNSTFSWWAAFLSDASDKLVVFPNPWFRKIPYSEKLIPKEWVPIMSGF